jgi:hypothetical protein
VTDAKVVDVFIVAGVLTGEILAEIVAVHADGYRELCVTEGQVPLSYEFILPTMSCTAAIYATLLSLQQGQQPQCICKDSYNS